MTIKKEETGTGRQNTDDALHNRATMANGWESACLGAEHEANGVFSSGDDGHGQADSGEQGVDNDDESGEERSLICQFSSYSSYTLTITGLPRTTAPAVSFYPSALTFLSPTACCVQTLAASSAHFGYAMFR